MSSPPKFSRKEFRGAFKLHEAFRELPPKKSVRMRIDPPKTLMSMGHVEAICYRTTHGKQSVLYKHDFAPGSRPVLAAGPKRNQLFLLGGRYHVTDRGIVDLTHEGREIDDPEHGEPLDDEE